MTLKQLWTCIINYFDLSSSDEKEEDSSQIDFKESLIKITKEAESKNGINFVEFVYMCMTVEAKSGNYFLDLSLESNYLYDLTNGTYGDFKKYKFLFRMPHVDGKYVRLSQLQKGYLDAFMKLNKFKYTLNGQKLYVSWDNED